MKKILLGLAIVTIASFSATAQQPERPMHQQGHHKFRGHGREMLAQKLHFSDQQKQQLKDINSNYHKKLADLKKNEDITVREFKTRMAALHKEHRDQMQALLTTEQKDQLAKMKQQRMETAKINANARAEKMKVKLGLSDAQASQLKDMRSGTFEKMKSIRKDNSLSPEQKKEQIKDLVAKQKEQLKTILTPEQLQQLQQMHGQHRRMDMSK